MFVCVGFSASAGDCDLSSILEARRLEGCRSEGFLMAAPAAGRVCGAGMVRCVVSLWKQYVIYVYFLKCRHRISSGETKNYK